MSPLGTDKRSLRPTRARLFSRPTALSSIAWLALTGFFLWLGVMIVRLSLGDLLAVSNPSLALLFDPGQAAAQAKLAQRAFADAARIDEAAKTARSSLEVSPFTPDALTLLALIAQQKKSDARAVDLMRWASRVDLRNVDSQLWLLERDVRNGDAASALQRVDMLFRGQSSEVLDPLVLALAPALTSELYRPGFVALLKTNPPWRTVVLSVLTRVTKDLVALNALISALQQSDAPPSSPELAGVMARLIDGGQFNQAYLAWTRSLPPERLGNLDYLYNARFQFALTNLPFDWLIAPAPQALIGVSTVDGRRLLNVDFFGGRVPFANVSHLLSLPPGTYEFSGRERAQNLKNERGLWWRVACLNKSADTLATSRLLSGEVPWREFALGFTVPAQNCAYQKLLLELPARVALESEIAGAVAYANFNLQPK
jgi:hypothetical protein